MNPVRSPSEKWGQRLDWLERVMAVVAVPTIAGAVGWAVGIERGMAALGQRIAVMEQHDAHEEQERRSAITILEILRDKQTEMLQRLAKIEALVAK